MAIVSKVKVEPNVENKKPQADVVVSFRVTQIVPGATTVRLRYRLLGGARVRFVTPSAPADGATVVSQTTKELLEKYKPDTFPSLVPVTRTIRLSADPDASADTLEVEAADFIDDTSFGTSASVAVIGFAQ
jgi:hypothetical protein